jgi:catechol 2,3-dioxygenase-like lactoylglutathione lyase family enzyme
MITINDTNLTIMTRDMDKSVAFYERIGFAMKQRWNNHYAMLTAGGLTVGLHPTDAESGQTSSGSLSIGLMVDRIGDAKSLLDELAIAYKAEDGGSGKYVHFKDPDGTVIYFVEPGWE